MAVTEFTLDTGLSGKSGQIAAELENRLLLGEYRFGETLSATQLASQFDASRQPVSAAISHLRSLGYVEVIPQVGCRVVSPPPEEIADFFVALAKIEAAGTAFAARRYSDPEARELIAIAEHPVIETLDTVADRQNYINDVHAYHAQIWNMARTPTLAKRMAGTRRLASFYLWQGSPLLVPASAQLLTMERFEIAQAISNRDTVRAELLMEKHISHKPYVNGIM